MVVAGVEVAMVEVVMVAVVVMMVVVGMVVVVMVVVVMVVMVVVTEWGDYTYQCLANGRPPESQQKSQQKRKALVDHSPTVGPLAA